MSEPSNPPAFPSGLDQNAEYSRTFQSPMHEGMTLRDYFAAAALTAIIQSCFTHNEKVGAGSEGYISHVMCVPSAYKVADAMLAERQKP